MKTLSLPLKGLVAIRLKPLSLWLIAVAGISFTSTLGQQPILADTGRSILQDLDPQRGNDPLGPRSDEIDNMGIFDLIHRFNQGSTVWDSQQQNQQLNDATVEFRKKQEQLLQQRGAQQPNTPLPVTSDQ